MADFALPACSSPFFVLDSGNGQLGRRFRARIVGNGFPWKENSRNLEFSTSLDSSKSDAGHREITVWKGKFRSNEYLRRVVLRETAELPHRGYGRSLPPSSCLSSRHGICCTELVNLRGLYAVETTNHGIVVCKYSERNRRLWCVGSRSVNGAYSRRPSFDKLGGFSHGGYEMSFDGKVGGFEADEGNTQEKSIFYPRLNRRKYGDGGFLEGEDCDSLAHAFDQKFKKGRKNGKNFTLVVGNEESAGSSVVNPSINNTPEISSMAFQGNDRSIDSEKGSESGSMDQLVKNESGTSSTTLMDEDDLLSMNCDLLEWRREMQHDENMAEKAGSSDLVGGDSIIGAQSEDEEVGNLIKTGLHGGRQVVRRSNVLAKQVISIQSALSLGFVSQLWVDTKSWMVLVVEVRPSLLSGEMERFLLKDISKVGDVMLISDESVMENDLRLIGLETLVGYNVITESNHTVGKVRGYTFNINSGAIESLELDSFGISIIPASLVSTYCLFLEDVLEVSSDTIVVEEGAVSRIQRLTKGFWGNQRMRADKNDYENEPNIQPRQRRRVSQNRSRARKFSSQRQEREDWDLPMDY